VGVSSYGPRRTEEAARILRELGPLLIHQPSYSIFNRRIEEELLALLENEGVGAIVFPPLAQGLLTDKYLDGVPDDSRVRRGNYFSSQPVASALLGASSVRQLEQNVRRSIG
jgi:L-glyceraldehyde 3-phosphate reductase